VVGGACERDNVLLRYQDNQRDFKAPLNFKSFTVVDFNFDCICLASYLGRLSLVNHNRNVKAVG
jgi:hypothetical protein